MKIINRLFFLTIAFAFFSGCYEKVSVTKAETNPPAATIPDFAVNKSQTFSPPPKKVETETQTKKLEHLKKWVGKYPINPEDRKYRNFFALTEVKAILVKTLPKKGLQNLLNHFYGVDLIEEKEGFLVMLGTTKRKTSGEVDYALVALKTETGETHIVFVDNGKMTGYGNTNGEDGLPASIEEKISGFVSQ